MATPQEGKQLVRRLLEIVNERRLDEVEEVATGAIAAAARHWIGPFRESFPDFRMELAGLVADADRVVAHFRCSGTHLGSWRGHPPTGRRFEAIDEIYVFRVGDGRLAGVDVVVEDDLRRLRQLGLVG